MNQGSFFCPRCNQMRLFGQKQMNHTPHILASVFLCGLWLPVWALIALTNNPPYHCQTCGFTDQTKYLNDPKLRERDHLEFVQREKDKIRHPEKYFPHTINWNYVVIITGVLIGGALVFGIFNALFVKPRNLAQLPSVGQTVKSTNNEIATAQVIGEYAKDNFSMTTWYKHITSFSVIADTVVVVTDLPSKNEAANGICGGVSSFVFDNNQTYGLKKVQVLSKYKDVLISRFDFTQQCK